MSFYSNRRVVLIVLDLKEYDARDLTERVGKILSNLVKKKKDKLIIIICKFQALGK